MELIRISDTRLKVMLTAEELRRYALRAEDMDYDKAETRRAIRQILEEVRLRIGFDASGERTLLQLYPCRKGGCELFVTVLPAADRDTQGSPEPLQASRPVLYLFDDMEGLLAACRALQAAGYTGTSRAYADSNGRTCLSLEEALLPPARTRLNALTPLCEFGQRCRIPLELLHMQEHGICLSDTDAVRTLAPLAL